MPQPPSVTSAIFLCPSSARGLLPHWCEVILQGSASLFLWSGASLSNTTRKSLLPITIVIIIAYLPAPRPPLSVYSRPHVGLMY